MECTKDCPLKVVKYACDGSFDCIKMEVWKKHYESDVLHNFVMGIKKEGDKNDRAD